VKTEFEARILQIDPAAIEKLILSRGGERVGEKFMRRYVSDIEPGDQSRWIRLRDTGTEITVGDFEATNQLLGRLGYRPKSYQENRRTSFLIEGVRLEIDHWPLIPPYLEIEADSEDGVLRTATLLGYTREDLTAENTIKIYRRYGHELNDLPELRLPPHPR
jgi:adenylate cyclase class 2